MLYGPMIPLKITLEISLQNRSNVSDQHFFFKYFLRIVFVKKI